MAERVTTSPVLAGPSGRSGGWRSHTLHLWAIVATVMMIAGVLASVSGAAAVASNNSEKAQQSFEQASGDVTSTVQLATQHQDDLVVNAGAYMAENPASSQTEFLRWTVSAQVLERYPELQALGVIVIVPASDLPAFADRYLADPLTSQLVPDGSFTVTPPGDRPFYCLAPLGVGRLAVTTIAAGLDLCAREDDERGLLANRDAAVGGYLPYKIAGLKVLAILTPVYAGGAPPATTAARRAAFVGWVGTLVSPSVVLDRALQGHPDMTVSLHYQRGSSETWFTRGDAPAGSQTLTTTLDDGWSIETSGAVAGAGIFSDGTAVALLATGVVLSVLLGLLIFILGTGRERARKLVSQRTNQLRHQALHDSLTGLPNRALVMDRIEQLLAHSRRHGTTASVFFLDLDDFKNVNDSLGHHAGDALLVAVSGRLGGTLRDADTLGRMGGDEFVVVVEGDPLEAGPELVAERLLDVMRQPFDLDEASIPLLVGLSIGIASGDRDSAGDLLRDADVALYQAKALGKNRYETFDATMQTTISRRNELEFQLRSGLSGDQYRLVYQPIYNLNDLAVVGVEALLRWDRPDGAPVTPDEFIPILEQTGQIREVGRWVLGEACRQMAVWHSRGDTLDVSVNISARQLDHDSIVTDISEALAASGLPAESLIIEITETALMRNADKTAHLLESIKALGVRIAVDDFGTGYSSLAYLRQFPVDCLKIDRYFTNAVTASPESKALIGTLVQLGKDLGLTTLAEGVETTDEMDLLIGADVDQAQGFLMARPMDPDTLEARLLAPTRSSTAATTVSS